jgi:glutathione S-transferase
MAPKLTLVYFDSSFWRAEMCRLALHIGGVEFEDKRCTREEFQAAKVAGEYPFGSVPVLYVEEGGASTCIAQSPSIARYCGKVAGLYPTDDLGAAVVDQILDSANDCTETLSASMREEDMETRLQMRKDVAATVLPTWLGYYEALLEEADGPFFAGEALTVADLCVAGLLGWLTSGVLDGIPTTLAEPFPCVTKMLSEVASHPKIQEWTQMHAKL